MTTRSILNIGCGPKKMEGAVNLDISAQVAPDVVHDLEHLPWPFEARSFDEVHAYDVIEHLSDVVRTLDEIHRICRPGAQVHITVPHFSSSNSYSDPTHRHVFSSSTLAYLDPEHPLSFYGHARFRVRTRQIVFEPTILNRAIARVAGRWPDAYERRWAWMFPAWFLYFQLEALE